MQYTIQGNGQIELNDRDFVAQGGQGKVYARDRRVYKIYPDPANMIPVAKIRELSVLDHPLILRPLDILLDAADTPVGFGMARAENALPLARLFTNDFRRQHHIQDADIMCLLDNMRETIAFIHHHDCLIVDGNEMNYLVDERDFQQAYFLDVDSYQTPGFPATALMHTIRDWHAPGFSPLTDWFAFAVVACQLLVGIHPYRGKHPDFKKGDLAGRMRANVSIFNPRVSLPATVRDFNIIPPALRDWMERLFEKGERLPPPGLTGAALGAAFAPPPPSGGDHLEISLEREFAEDIHDVFAWQGRRAVFAGKTLHLDAESHALAPGENGLILSPQSLTPLVASLEGDSPRLRPLDGCAPVLTGLKAGRLLRVENTLYAVYQDRLTALRIHEMDGKYLAGPGTSWAIMPQAHQVLDGLIYQSVLGKPYLVIPYRQGQACLIREIPELANYRVMEGRHDKGVVMLIGHVQGRYDRLLLRFSPDYRHYDFQCEQNLEQSGLNFVTLDNGVVVHLLEEGEIRLFSRQGDQVKSVQDSGLDGYPRLAVDGVQVLAYLGKRLYRLRLKKV